MTILAVVKYVDKNQNAITWDEELTASDMKDLRGQFREKFGNCKRSKQYTELKDGSSYHSGYVFHYWDHYNDTGKRFLAEAWVTLYEVNPIKLGDE